MSHERQRNAAEGRHWYDPTPNSGCGVCSEHRDANVHRRIDVRMDESAERTWLERRQRVSGPHVIAPDRGVPVHNTRHPWWSTALAGRIYRPVMKLTHRWGWCYPQGTLVNERDVWCRWCGMHGTRPPRVDDAIIGAKMRDAGRER